MVTGARQGFVSERVVKRSCVAFRRQFPRSAAGERVQVLVEGRGEGGGGGVMGTAWASCSKRSGGRTYGIRLNSKSGSARYLGSKRHAKPLKDICRWRHSLLFDEGIPVCLQARMMHAYLA